MERVSVSDYRNHFILKGGMLVASIIGIDMRICAIPLEDDVTFRITSVSDIMTDFEYPGVRMMLEAVLERMRQVIKIDISTDDVITPSAVEYEYKLMFEDRTIQYALFIKEGSRTSNNRKIKLAKNKICANIYIWTFYQSKLSVGKYHSIIKVS